jgi:hypothetical protein
MGLKLMAQLPVINNIYETEEWSKDFAEVTIIALKKKPKATRCSKYCTISLIAHAAKTVMRICRRRIETIEDVIGEDKFGFRRGKGTSDATGMLRITSE